MLDRQTIQRIGLGIIETALSESMGRASQPNSPSHRERLREEADLWFREPNEGFDLACDMVGADPDCVRRAYLSGALQRAHDARINAPLSPASWRAVAGIDLP